MKNSKTLLALLLAFVMMFSAFGVLAEDTAATAEATANTDTTAASADASSAFSDVTANSTVGEAVTKLVAYGIISGYPDGTFKPDGEITRAEFAAVIARFNGTAESFGTDAVTGFADLDGDESRAWARPYVKAAVDSKIINGFEDGSFRAAEPVTYEQAVKMIICAIEYTPVAESELNRLKLTDPEGTTWSSGYIAAANKNNITKGAITANITGAASRGTVAVLVSNALDAPKLKVVTDSNGNVSYQKDEGSVSDDRYNAKEKVEGYVSGTYYTGLDDQFPDISTAEINITTNEGEKTYELSSSLQNSTDLEDIIGRRVLAYYDKDTEQIVSIIDKTDKTIRINEESIQSISGDTVKYYDANGKNASASLNGYKFIYNGKYMENMQLSDIDPENASSPYQLKSGYIELVSSTSSKVAKVVSYQVFVVNNYDRTNEKIYFRYNQKYGENNYYVFPQQTSKKPEIYVSSGSKYTKTAFSSLSLSQYDVINLLESPGDASGNALNKMYVTKGVKTGKVTSKTDDEREVEMGDKIYYLTNSYLEYAPASSSDEEKAKFELDESYSFYLDCMGLIAAVKYSAATAGTYKYGYIMTAGKVDSNYMVRMINQEGKDTKYTLKATVKVDGSKKKDSEVIDVLERTAQTANEAYNSVAPGWGGEALSGTYYCQPVRYSLSGSYIETIDTVVVNDSSDSSDIFSYDRKLTGTTKVNGTTSLGTGENAFGADGNTKIFYVPDERNDYSSYSLMDNSKAFANKGNLYMEVFNIDDTSATKRAKMIVVYHRDPSLAFVASSPYMVVTKTYVEGDNTVIEGYKNAAQEVSKVVVSDEKFLSGEVGGVQCSAGPDVEKGDLIRYLTDASGEAIAINIWYDASNPAQKEAAGSKDEAKELRVLNGFVSSNFNIRYGMPVEVNTDTKELIVSYLTTAEAGIEDYEPTEAALLYKVGSSTRIYEYNSKDGVIPLESIDSIYDMSVDTPSRVIMISPYQSETTANTPRVIYLIND